MSSLSEKKGKPLNFSVSFEINKKYRRKEQDSERGHRQRFIANVPEEVSKNLNLGKHSNIH